MMRKEIIATLLISLYWMIAGFFVAYSAWDHSFMIDHLWWQSALPDPYTLGIPLAIIGLIFTFVILRTMLPSRATQRRRLMKLLDEIGVEDIDAIQRKLSAVSTEAEEFEKAASLRELLQAQKRKNGMG